MIEFPIPIVHNGTRYTKCDVVAPKTSAIADTERESHKNIYSAMHVFISGGISAIYAEEGQTVEDPIQIKNICRRMPYKTAEFVSLQIVLEIDPDDGFEGVYGCPRCGHKQIAEYEDGADSRDHLSDMETRYMGSGEPAFDITVDPPLEIKDKSTGEVIEAVTSLRMEYPTLGTCIAASGKYGASGGLRQQFAFYVDSLLQINGEEVDQKTRAQWGMYIFENLRTGKQGPLAQVGREMRRYGMDQTIQKTCPSCGKVWWADVDTSNFFGSALRSL